MINVSNMTKTGVVDNIPEFKFEFEFDNASTLPVKTYVLGQKTYLIAKDSTAKNLSTNTYYKYGGVDDKWVKVLPTPTPTPVDNTKITDNGDYSLINNDFTGYNEVSVDVSAEPTVLIEKSITENGEYLASDDEANGYSKVTVDVAGGGAGGTDVIFYDYDGTVVASYSAADFANLSAMPANPTHTGLTAQGWNWSLADAKTYVATYGNLNIGQMYITSDGKTRLYYVIPKDNLTLDLYLSLNEDTELDIDWGDGEEHTTWTSEDGEYTKNHAYSDAGNYIVAITVIRGGFTPVDTDGRYGSTLKRVEFGSGVTTIETGAFQYCSALTSIIIPNSVESIGSEAFHYCYALTSITIPNSVTSIEDSTFYDCYALTSITIPNSVTSIENCAFSTCQALSSITIPSSVESIGSEVFTYCYALTSITIPNSVTSIGDSAFSGCYGLTSITIPTNISNGTFSYCYALTSITIPSSVESIDNEAFYYCYGLATITIPNSVTGIGRAAFSYCSALTSITIPNSVENIYSEAFSNCCALSLITFEPTTPPGLDGDLGLPTTCIIRVPQGTLSDYTSASNYPDPSQYIYEEY